MIMDAVQGMTTIGCNVCSLTKSVNKNSVSTGIWNDTQSCDTTSPRYVTAGKTFHATLQKREDV